MMQWRRLFPAICVGSGTVLADNPSLTARLPEGTFCPIRLVLDSRLSTFDEAYSNFAIYSDEFSSKTKVITTSVGLNNKHAVDRAKKLGIALIEGTQDGNEKIKLSELPRILKELRITALYCEGGADGIVGYLFRYLSQKICGPDAPTGPK